MPANTRATYTKTCEHCHITYERKRHANGCLENITQWKKRRACGPACGNELRKKTYAARREQHLIDYQHPPCTHCAGPVPKNPGEKYKRWRERRTCSSACSMAAMSSANPRGTPANLTRGGRPRNRQKLANAGYVFNGRFPTPPGVTKWQSVFGPDTGVIATTPNNTVTKSAQTVAMLRSAISAHPDLGIALLGHLSDSWVQQDAATYHG